MATQFSAHVSEEEMACHDGTSYPFDQVDDEDDEERTWRETRATPLVQIFEDIRAAASDEVVRLGLGPAQPDGYGIIILSAYRTLAYDGRLYDASAKNGDVASPTSSQHPKGRALDLRHTRLGVREFHSLILRMKQGGQLPNLGGLGIYPTFVHVDVRPWIGHLAQWQGGRTVTQVA